MAIAPTVERTLAEYRVDVRLLPHPRTASTHGTATAAHVPQDHIAKAVIVKDDQGYAMVVIPGDSWIKLDALNAELNRRFQLASEPEVGGLFDDCAVGAVPPLGDAYGLETYVDDSLARLAQVYIESGDHELLAALSGSDFQALMRGVRHGHFSHEH
jgi:Ala-tRNA(Pro) deacylase